MIRFSRNLANMFYFTTPLFYLSLLRKVVLNMNLGILPGHGVQMIGWYELLGEPWLAAMKQNTMGWILSDYVTCRTTSSNSSSLIINQHNLSQTIIAFNHFCFVVLYYADAIRFVIHVQSCRVILQLQSKDFKRQSMTTRSSLIKGLTFLLSSDKEHTHTAS